MVEPLPSPNYELVGNPYDNSILFEDTLPLNLHKEVPDDCDDFEYWFSQQAEQHISPYFESQNHDDYGNFGTELLEIESEERRIQDDIRRDFALMRLLYLRIKRREQRLEWIDEVRADFVEDYAKEQSERLEQAEPAREPDGNGEE